MLNFLRLIRFPNLLIMAYTQYMVRWFLIKPVIDVKQSQLGLDLIGLAMSEFDFFLLVLSTVLIGAAGYIINDYFDVRIDEVNRPATNLVGKSIKRRVAMVVHMSFNIVGAGLGIWLSYKYNIFRLGSFIYVLAPALLWFYSTNLKRVFLAGNLIIALLTGFVPLIVVLFEIPNIYLSPTVQELVQSGCFNLDAVLHITLVLSLFAFGVSLLREIIKDTEDYEGDLAYGCKTLPIVMGIAKTKYVLVALAAGIMFMLGYLQYKQLNQDSNIVINAQGDKVNGLVVTATDTIANKTYPGEIGCNVAVIHVPANKTYKIVFPDGSVTTAVSPDVPKDWTSFSYFIFLLQLPLLYLIYRIFNAKGKKDWRFASTLVKLIMVSGISYLFLYAYLINQTA